MKTNLYLILALTLMLAGCGVRGRPSPPDIPAPIGRGEPSFSKATEKLVVPQRKKNNRGMQDDWNDPTDFESGEAK
jgi:hypothetical protein